MDEFDDNMTQIQLISNKLMHQGYQMELKPLNSDTYFYLTQNVIYSGFNKIMLRNRVKEVYKDMLMANDNEVPELYDVVDAIDEENVAILYAFYNGYNWDDEEIENIIAHYKHNIACMLDDYITEIFQDEGMYLRGIALARVFDNHSDKTNTITDGEGQNLINREWL